MPISTANGLAAVLNVLLKQASAEDTDLEFFEYLPTTGYEAKGVVTESWFSFRDTTREGRFLFLIIVDSTAMQDLFAERPTHALTGGRYYKLTEVPEEPIASNDMIKYWLVKCEPTGKRTA